MPYEVSENIIESMQRNSERMGYSMNESYGKTDGRISKVVNTVLQEQKRGSITVSEVRPETSKWCIYLDGVLNKNDRKEIISAVAKKMGVSEDMFKIVAFYY